ncbi:hypothetical protein [Legionella hackeliae]|uniref:Uncharacterized protein n=1 Tax=Legionella hackeliae TaxID=449 RepID=A0A0A8UPL3_LEGHA|nr:hypothetical protein [Legionella hackeliae]KTD11504.1 hypothetical protein Lhac_1900 [Legionella hackeliae]CEK10663.1 protein of unknown function [Legionella hackeliae]STX47409.1 Uncharacterised protein [Legionella hackeliae]
MLDIYIWNPSKPGKANPYSNDFKTLAKIAMKRGAVGHISMAATVYEDSANFTKVSNDPDLSDILKPAIPTYARIVDNPSGDETVYRRGRKLEGVTAVNSFWPSKAIGKKLFGKSILKAGSKIDAILADSILKDMVSESAFPNSLIHHGKFFKSENRFVSYRERLSSALQKQAEQYDLDYLSLVNELATVDNSLKKMQELYPSVKYNGNINDPKKVLGLKKVKIHYWYHDRKNYEDGDGKLYASSINYDAMSDALIAVQKLVETTKNEFHGLLPELKALHNPALNSLCDEYLELTREVGYLSQSPDPFAGAHHAIAESKLAIVRMQMIDEIEGVHSNKYQRLIEKMVDVDSRLHSASQQVETISKDIETVKALKDKLIKIQDKKDDVRAKRKICIEERDRLLREISVFEQTEGRNADHVIPLPTSESGKHFFIDEVAIMQHIKENNDAPLKYQLFGENCARSVKRCLLAAIGENKELKSALENMDDLPKDFFKYKFIETPGSVMKWVLELSKRLDTLNYKYDHEHNLRASNAPS